MTVPAPTPPPTPGPEPVTGPTSSIVVGVVTATAVLVVGTLLAVGLVLGAGRYTIAQERPAHGVAAGMPAAIAADGVLTLDSVTPAVATEYRSAADHAEHYQHLRCWCGCEAAFDHPSLLECFVRPEGDWEAHGAGCAVCLGEAMIARARLDAGVPLPDIAAELDAAYGPASIPAATPTQKDTST